MAKKIRIGICGYGNLGHGVELAVKRAEDMELVGIFSRRDLPGTASGVPAINLKHVLEYKDKIDVMVLCGGSATDLMEQGPELAQYFVTVDSFDTHPRIPEYFAKMDAVTKANDTAAIISVGWDPGLFSLLRVLGDSVLPEGKSYTFWGKGVSQGHSDAIRRIPGVKNGKQYTIPKDEFLEAVRSGKGTDAPGNEMHLRECFVVPKEGADLQAIETAIKTMPNYFVGYETIVHFISEEEFAKNHSGIPHGGFVFRNGKTDETTGHVMEFSLKLDSNPQFTSSVLTAFARAMYRLYYEQGKRGAFTVLDIPFALLSPKAPADLRKFML
jgi:diaminopimelate dehydrogenase